MNVNGIILAILCFAIIGVFHPIVIKAEYYFTEKCWPIFAMLGVIFVIASLCITHEIGSSVLGLIGCSFFWSIIELKEQKERVEKGWFPCNPKRMK